MARLTYAVARRGSCTQNVLRSLAGSLVHPFMHRRSLMSSLSAIYRLIDTMSPVGETSLLPAVVDELLCGCLLLCFAFTDIRSPVCPTVSATDATCSKGGAARALVPPSLARASCFIKPSVFKNTVIVESKTQISALFSITNFCKSICKTRFCSAIYQLDVTDLHVASDHVIADIQMTYTTKFVGIVGQDLSSRRVRVHTMWFWWLNVEKLQFVFNCFDIFKSC